METICGAKVYVSKSLRNSRLTNDAGQGASLELSVKRHRNRRRRTPGSIQPQDVAATLTNRCESLALEDSADLAARQHTQSTQPQPQRESRTLHCAAARTTSEGSADSKNSSRASMSAIRCSTWLVEDHNVAAPPAEYETSTSTSVAAYEFPSATVPRTQECPERSMKVRGWPGSRKRATREEPSARTPRRTRKEPALPQAFCRCDGRGERIRTSDPSVPNRVLYQAEPRPDRRFVARW